MKKMKELNKVLDSWPPNWSPRHKASIIRNVKTLEEVIEDIQELPYDKQKEYPEVIEYYIDEMFFYIMKFTNQSFTNEEIKNDIIKKTELDFYKRNQIDEAGNKTIGIKTLWQLEKFRRHYNEQLRILWDKMVNVQIEIYEKLEFSSLGKVLNDDVRSLKRFALFYERSFLSDKLTNLAVMEKEHWKDTCVQKEVSIPIFKTSFNKEQTSKVFDFNMIKTFIRFDKDESTREAFKKCLDSIYGDNKFDLKNGLEFSTIAYISYDTGNVVNTNAFSKWLDVFSKSFFRETPKYKPNHLRLFIERTKIKFPCLDKLPKKIDKY